MSNRFTERAQRVILIAQEEAKRLKSEIFPERIPSINSFEEGCFFLNFWLLVRLGIFCQTKIQIYVVIRQKL